MTGYGEVLKALSAMASITSCSQDKNDKNKTGHNPSAQVLFVENYSTVNVLQE